MIYLDQTDPRCAGYRCIRSNRDRHGFDADILIIFGTLCAIFVYMLEYKHLQDII